MNLNINHNDIITTSRKIANRPNFGNKPNYVMPQNNNIDNEEMKDTALKIGGALTVLTGLGVALVNRDRVLSFFKKTNNYVKNGFKKPEYYLKDFDSRPHGGPTINLKNGKFAIKQAWNQHIKDIERRIANHDQKEKLYQQLLAPDSTRANEIEQLAKKRCLARGGKWE